VFDVVTYMNSIRQSGRVLALIGLGLVLCGCIEVEEQYRISRDGKADARILIKVDPEYEALVLPELEKRMREEPPPGMKIDSSQRIDGKAAILIEGQGLDLATLNTGDQPMQLVESSAGFLKKRYTFSVSAGKRPDVPVPHRLRVTLPGSIEQTNGRKIDSETVEFDLTNARRGTRYQATSTAFALSLSSGGSHANANSPKPSSWAVGSGAASPAWLLPMSIGAIVLGVISFVVGWVVKRRATAAQMMASPPQLAAVAQRQASDGGPPLSSVFCSECGVAQEATRKFCTGCGAKLS